MAKTMRLYNASVVISIIAEELENRHVSKKWLAEKIGHSEQMVNNLFRGDVPPLMMILRICNVLDITPDYLLGYMDDPDYLAKIRRMGDRIYG